MDIPLASTAPARLYAIVLKLRPLTQGSLMAFSGEQVHAAFFNWVRSAAPEVSAWLHEDGKRRLFTCSSLQFPFAAERMREAEYKNLHLPLFPDKIYTVRITLLLTDLFPLLYTALVHPTMQTTDIEREPFMRLGKQDFLLQEAVMSADPAGWTGFTTFAALVEQLQARSMQETETLSLEFASLTTINWINRHNKQHGNHYAMLPLPLYIFPMLAIRWRELAPPEIAHVVQVECIERYIQDDGMPISHYDLRPHFVSFVKYPQRGFVGTCTYQLRGPDETSTPDSPLTVRQQILLLAQFAFYSGIGYKTAMGLGQVRPITPVGEYHHA